MNKSLLNGKIYVLKHPITGEIRYVGKTEDKYPIRRLKTHIQHAKTKKEKTHNLDWIRSLINQNLFPEMEIIDFGYTSRKELCEAEIFLIQFYKDIGLSLTNSTNGRRVFFGKIRQESIRKNNTKTNKCKFT